MATEIQQARLDHSLGDKASEGFRGNEKAGVEEIIEPYVADLEGEGHEAEKQRLVEKAEAVELTPVEAFTWNVEGDQSPCE